MTLEEKILQIIDNEEDHFFSPDFDGLISHEEHSRAEITKACFSLVDKGILKRRDCIGLAFERI